jgi:hypothetical protein
MGAFLPEHYGYGKSQLRACCFSRRLKKMKDPTDEDSIDKHASDSISSQALIDQPGSHQVPTQEPSSCDYQLDGYLTRVSRYGSWPRT